MNILYKILKYRSIPLNLLFVLYLLFIQPVLLGELAQLAEHDQPSLMFGILALVIQFLELLAFYLKRPVMEHYMRPGMKAYQTPAQASFLMFIPLLHLGMAAFLYIAAAQIGGFQPSDDAGFWPQMAFLLGMFVILAKEGLLLQWWFSPFGKGKNAKKAYPPAASEVTLVQALLDFLGDILLLVFAAVGYTALWNYIAVGTPLESGSLWQMAVQYIGVLLLYFMTVVPLRGVYYMFLPFFKLTKRQVVFEWVGLIVSFLVAAASVPVG